MTPTMSSHGLDYPIGQVRWTEQRNMAAFLDLAAEARLRPSELVTHRFPIEEAEAAFEALEQDESVVGVVLRYGKAVPASRRQSDLCHRPGGAVAKPSAPRFGLIGAGILRNEHRGSGAFALRVRACRRRCQHRAFGRERAATVWVRDRPCTRRGDAWSGDDLDLIVIATRHDSHAELTARALEAGIARLCRKAAGARRRGTGTGDGRSAQY